MAETFTIPPAILTTDARLGEPVPLLDGRVSAFGDLDLLGRLGLTNFNSDKFFFESRVKSLAGHDSAELIYNPFGGGIVTRYGEYAVKYCWEAASVDEGIISEAMRLGLESTQHEGRHGITVPPVVAGITDEDRGILITKYIAGHKPVLEFGHQSKKRFENDWRTRMDHYRDALQTVGLEGAADLLHNDDFDDLPRNTLWPANFFVVGERVLPSSSVRLDFGALARVLRTQMPPVTSQSD